MYFSSSSPLSPGSAGTPGRLWKFSRKSPDHLQALLHRRPYIQSISWRGRVTVEGWRAVDWLIVGGLQRATAESALLYGVCTPKAQEVRHAGCHFARVSHLFLQGWRHRLSLAAVSAQHKEEPT